MAKARRVTVLTTVTRLDDPARVGPVEITVRAPGGSIYIGDATVSTSDGFELPAGGVYTAVLKRGEQLRAYAVGASQVTHVLDGTAS